jgi:hypothetical protein
LPAVPSGDVRSTDNEEPAENPRSPAGEQNFGGKRGTT